MKSSTPQKQPISLSRERLLGWSLVLVITIIMLLQLFTFEQFPALIQEVGVGDGGAKLIAVILVLVGLAVLPGLLGVVRGRNLRLATLCGVVVLMIGLCTVNLVGSASGLSVGFGATLTVPSGAWSVTFLGAMTILALWWFVAGNETDRSVRDNIQPKLSATRKSVATKSKKASKRRSR